MVKEWKEEDGGKLLGEKHNVQRLSILEVHITLTFDISLPRRSKHVTSYKNNYKGSFSLIKDIAFACLYPALILTSFLCILLDISQHLGQVVHSKNKSLHRERVL